MSSYRSHRRPRASLAGLLACGGLIACNATSGGEGVSAAAAAAVDQTAASGTATATASTPAAANTNPSTGGTVQIDGTVSGMALTVGGPAMAWPPVGVSAMPPLGQACGTTLDASGMVPSLVPPAYLASCAGCHGPAGAGNANYPNIVGGRTWATFSAVLRAGKTGSFGLMPAFSDARLSDDDMRRIYAFVNQAPLVETGICSQSAPMAAADVDQALKDGLAAWRRTDSAGHDGFGCFECHGPDSLTFAYFGFNDGDILRRAAKHIAIDDAFAIVDMVHAQRDKYGIVKRDPMAARPLQPGGVLLPGATAAARDLAFGQELQSMGLTLANGYINSGAAAKLAAAELGNINLHALRIPIPFNHLAEDKYHNTQAGPLDCNDDIDTCADHGSLSDWMPIEPHIPTNLSQFFAAEDAYLANPNLATFYGAYGAVPPSQTMPGSYPSGYNYQVDDNKFRSQFVLDYCLRRELMQQPGCYDAGIFPFDPNQRINSIWAEGENANLFGMGLSTQPACDVGTASCNPIQAPQFYTKLTPGAKISDSFQRLRVPWFAMHWSHFDPTMLETGDATIQQDEYFARDIFWSNNDQDYAFADLHETYSIYAVFQVTMHNIKVLATPEANSCDKIPFNHPDLGRQVCTAIDLRSGYYPQLCNFAEGKNWHNDSNQQLAYVPKDAPRKALYQRIGGNLYRMFLRGLIDKLQEDNWMCSPSMQKLRIARAKTFLAQPEIVVANGPADTEMFATLAALMAQSRQSCPPFDNTQAATF